MKFSFVETNDTLSTFKKLSKKMIIDLNNLGLTIDDQDSFRLQFFSTDSLKLPDEAFYYLSKATAIDNHIVFLTITYQNLEPVFLSLPYKNNLEITQTSYSLFFRHLFLIMSLLNDGVSVSFLNELSLANLSSDVGRKIESINLSIGLIQNYFNNHLKNRNLLAVLYFDLAQNYMNNKNYNAARHYLFEILNYVNEITITSLAFFTYQLITTISKFNNMKIQKEFYEEMVNVAIKDYELGIKATIKEPIDALSLIANRYYMDHEFGMALENINKAIDYFKYALEKTMSIDMLMRGANLYQSAALICDNINVNEAIKYSLNAIDFYKQIKEMTDNIDDDLILYDEYHKLARRFQKIKEYKETNYYNLTSIDLLRHALSTHGSDKIKRLLINELKDYTVFLKESNNLLSIQNYLKEGLVLTEELYINSKNDSERLDLAMMISYFISTRTSLFYLKGEKEKAYEMAKNLEHKVLEFKGIDFNIDDQVKYARLRLNFIACFSSIGLIQETLPYYFDVFKSLDIVLNARENISDAVMELEALDSLCHYAFEINNLDIVYENAMKLKNHSLRFYDLYQKPIFNYSCHRGFYFLAKSKSTNEPYDDAYFYYNESLKYINQAVNIDKKYLYEMAETYHDLALLGSKARNHEIALENFDLALKTANLIENKDNFNTDGLILTLHIETGDEYLYAQNLNKALEEYLLALNLVKKTGQKKELSICYEKLSQIYNQLGHQELSLEYSILDAELSKESYFNKPNQKNAVRYLYKSARISDYYIKKHDFEKAKYYALEEAKILETIIQNDDKEEFKIDLGKAYLKLTTISFDIHDYLESSNYSEKAIAIYKNVDETLFKSIKYYFLAQSYYFHGLANHKLLKSDIAYNSLKNASIYYEDIIEKDKKETDLTFISSTYDVLASLARKNQEKENELLYLNKLLEKTLLLNYLNKNYKNQYTLAQSYNRLGNIYGELKDYDKVISNHLKELEILYELQSKNYQNNLKINILACYQRLTISYLAKNNTEEALRFSDRSIGLAESLYLTFNSIDSKKEYVNTLLNHANILFSIKRYQESSTFFTDAYKYASELDFETDDIKNKKVLAYICQKMSQICQFFEETEAYNMWNNKYIVYVNETRTNIK